MATSLRRRGRVFDDRRYVPVLVGQAPTDGAGGPSRAREASELAAGVVERRPAVVGLLMVAATMSLAGGLAVLTGDGSRPAVALPAPRPADVASSGVLSVFPMPGTPTASAKTQISLRGLTPARLGPVRVVGSRSGDHAGSLEAHSDGNGASFVPVSGFEPGETVVVTTEHDIRGGNGRSYAFSIGRPAPLPIIDIAAGAPTPLERHDEDGLTFASRPDIRPMRITVSTPATDTAPGYLFVTPTGGRTQGGPAMYDDDGELVWFKPVAPPDRALAFAAQELAGRPVLTWYEGSVIRPGIGFGTFVVMDDHYREVARVRAGNGYDADIHEFQLTPQGTALFLIYSPVFADTSAVGGAPARPVFDSIVQEVDVATGLVVFEWHSLGQVDLNEAVVPVPKPDEAMPFDYLHPNSVTVTLDGDLLMSARHTSTVYKLDRVTGLIEWRLGGERSDFVAGLGATFAYQHDARQQQDGTYTIFDNAASSDTQAAEFSRGLVLRLDERRLTASLAVELVGVPRLARSQGSVQRLPNGNHLVGWGSEPALTEFGPGGAVRLELRLPDHRPGPVANSYRAYRFEWRGRPDDSPAVVASRRSTGVVVRVSWNGATDVARWRLRTGSAPDNLQPTEARARHGFETTLQASGVTTHVMAEALAQDGRILGRSAVVPVSG